MRTKIGPFIALLFLAVLLGALPVQAEEAAQEADNAPAGDSLTKGRFNLAYAPPFGFRPDARVENYARFGFITAQGQVEGFDKNMYGAIFGLQLAKEDVFAFLVQIKYENIKQDLSYQVCQGEVSDCMVKTQNMKDSNTRIDITPKYRFLNRERIWGSVSLTGAFPISAREGEPPIYEVSPGMQWYFDAVPEWFGIELDLQYLLDITDPDEPAYVPGYKYAPQDNEELTHGVFGRVNFLLKIKQIAYINLQVDDTVWFRDIDEAVARALARNEMDITTEAERLNLMYYATHQLDARAGLHIIYKRFEGGLGAVVPITQRERRQDWGVNADMRVTF